MLNALTFPRSALPSPCADLCRLPVGWSRRLRCLLWPSPPRPRGSHLRPSPTLPGRSRERQEIDRAAVGLGFDSVSAKTHLPVALLTVLAYVCDVIGWFLGKKMKLTPFVVRLLTMHRFTTVRDSRMFHALSFHADPTMLSDACSCCSKS